MPIFIGYIEMSWAVPGRSPVSDMYWTIVMGPNQSRCLRPLGVVAVVHVGGTGAGRRRR